MNTPEEGRVIAALQALTGGLDMSDNELLDARDRLRRRTSTPQGPASRRPVLVLLAAAAAIVLVLGVLVVQLVRDDDDAAPGPTGTSSPAEVLTDALVDNPYDLTEGQFLTGEPVTRQNLAGLWFLSLDQAGLPGDSVFLPMPMIISRNGWWRSGVATHPLAFGPSRIGGGEWTRILDGRAQCARGAGVDGYEQIADAVIAADGALRINLVSRTQCTLLDEREVWHRLAPGSPVLEYFRDTADEIAWGAWDATGETPSSGMYVDAATGHVLAVHPDGRYWYYTDLAERRLLAADRGTLKISADGSVAGTCRTGTFRGTAQTGNTAPVTGPLVAQKTLRITETVGDCGTVGDDKVWVRLVHGVTDTPYPADR